MKRSVLSLIILYLLFSNPSNGQVGKFLKNVKNSVADDLLGNNNKNSSKPGPEPSCACDPADLIFEVGKYNIDYSELNISVLSDGRILLCDKLTSSYYVVKNGVTEGPIKENDPRVKQFRDVVDKDDYQKAMELMYKDYISKKGDKYTITFADKTYGPYGRIERFEVTRSKDKFAASVIENIIVTEAEGEAMDEAVKNAKTEQEKMDLAMKYGMQMQEKLLSGGGPESMSPKLVSNLPIGNLALVTLASNFLNTSMKYNDILLVDAHKISDLQGKTLFNLSIGQYDPQNTFISEDNSRYATYAYGTLTISDGKKLSELFNPTLIKADGKIYLAYMYYSPKKNAIMQCKIPF